MTKNNPSFFLFHDSFSPFLKSHTWSTRSGFYCSWSTIVAFTLFWITWLSILFWSVMRNTSSCCKTCKNSSCWKTCTNFKTSYSFCWRNALLTMKIDSICELEITSKIISPKIKIFSKPLKDFLLDPFFYNCIWIRTFLIFLINLPKRVFKIITYRHWCYI